MEIGNNIMCYIMFVPALFLSHMTLVVGLLGIDGTTIRAFYFTLYSCIHSLPYTNLVYSKSGKRSSKTFLFLRVHRLLYLLTGVSFNRV